MNTVILLGALLTLGFWSSIVAIVLGYTDEGNPYVRRAGFALLLVCSFFMIFH